MSVEYAMVLVGQFDDFIHEMLFVVVHFDERQIRQTYLTNERFDAFKQKETKRREKKSAKEKTRPDTRP